MANKEKPQCHLICILPLCYPLSSQAVLCPAKQLALPRSRRLPCLNLKGTNRRVESERVFGVQTQPLHDEELALPRGTGFCVEDIMVNTERTKFQLKCWEYGMLLLL